MQLNTTQLEQVVQTAKAKVAGQPRWERAIDRAAEELYTNPYVDYRDGVLLLLSATSRKLYEVGARCTCEAATYGKACRHMAMRRLLERYMEAVNG